MERSPLAFVSISHDCGGLINGSGGHPVCSWGEVDLRLHHRDCWVSKFYAEPPSSACSSLFSSLVGLSPPLPPGALDDGSPYLTGYPGTWHNVYSCLEVIILSR